MFVPVNSGSLPPDLLESTLFGHVRGAFTSAIQTKKGYFEVADKGTIFFDEIGNLGPETQIKMLRVIQEKEFTPLGATDPVKVDVRIVAATNADLAQLVKDGRFREDLYYRLNVINIVLPPLRDRKEDIPLLVEHFFNYYCQENGKYLDSHGKSTLHFDGEAMQVLKEHAWPGNVRELENVVRQSLLLGRGYPVSLDHAQQACARTRKPIATSDQTIAGYFAELLSRAQRGELADIRARMTEDMERELFTRAIQVAGGNQAKAARWLGVTRTTMREKLVHFGKHPAAEQAGEK
jgi:transcriptional regulator with GAF, ATPase, and Fis domain